MSKKKAAAKQRKKNDAAYRRALGLTRGAELPAQLGSTGRSPAAAGAATPKPAAKRKTTGSTTNSRKTTHKGKTNAGPRTPVVKAKFAGKCAWCGESYPVGTPLGKIEDEWAHTYCVTDRQQRQAILSGQTFRSQHPSGWRLGQSPGAAKVTR